MSKSPQFLRLLKPELKNFYRCQQQVPAEADTGWRTEIHVLNNPCQLVSVSTIKFDRFKINNEPAEVKEKSASSA